ncbi:hypothetical protein [Gaiella sp.]|uniref:hypothetical protein n=1 Tax=Gaiella sp. TaxID=2663207 RepID=UPI003982DE3C
MSALPLSETADKRRIGDILLAQGFVTADELADAELEQERTQQPLGQVLVSRGAITRLELASALAEQWSDPSASITSTPRAAPSLAPLPSAQDEAQYAARLQEAVADLARKVQSNTPLEGIDERVDELSRRIEGTLARTQHIEAAVATLAESLEGVTTGVEEAFSALQTGTAELVNDLARVEQAVAEIAARDVPHGDGPALEDIEELRAAVSGLTEGAAGTAELEEQVNELARRLGALADPQRGLDEVTRRVEHVAEQLDALRSTANLDELQSAVRDLESQSRSFSSLAERLDRFEGESAVDPFRADLESQARLLEELRIVVAELRDRPSGVPETTERLDRLAVGLEQSSEARAELTSRVDELAARLAERKDEDPRVDDVVGRVAGLDARLGETALAVEHVTAAIARHDEAALDGRLDDLSRSLETVRVEIANGAAAGRLDEPIAERIDMLAAQVEMLAERQGESGELGAKLAALETRLAEGVVTPARLTDALATLRSDDLTEKVDSLVERLAQGVVTPDGLTSSIELALSERDAPLVDERVAELTSDVAALRAEVASLLEDRSHAPSEDGDLAARLDKLESARRDDLDTVNVLAVAMDRIRHDLTTPRPPAEARSAELREAVSALAERIGALENVPVAPGVPVQAGSEFAAELSGFRVALERVAQHLGEHDRAFADLAPSHGAQERIQELTALVQGLAEAQQNAPAQQAARASVPASGDIGSLLQRVEEAEAASQTDAEKLMNRLEKMASSIDWRLQRLELDPPDESN